MMEALARDPKKVTDPNYLMVDEMAKLEDKANEVVKAALLVSRADKRRFGRFEDELANNSLLGTDQYPNKKKVQRYLINHLLSTIHKRTILCFSFPSRDRATAPGQYEFKSCYS